jgi:hypothetical protein
LTYSITYISIEFSIFELVASVGAIGFGSVAVERLQLAKYFTVGAAVGSKLLALLHLVMYVAIGSAL